MNEGVFSNAVTLNDHFNIRTMYVIAVATCQFGWQNNECKTNEKKKAKQKRQRIVNAPND